MLNKKIQEEREQAQKIAKLKEKIKDLELDLVKTENDRSSRPEIDRVPRLSRNISEKAS